MATGHGVANTAQDEEESEYYDILLVGRTGMGKSSTGNKLLNRPNKQDSFVTGEGVHSCTDQCRVLFNKETIIRVLDTPGFADSKRKNVLQSNLQTFRWIMYAQEEYDLNFSRVLYFYPQRGPAEKADGTLQEEIQVMHGFLGESVFKIMVIIATISPKPKYQRVGFDDDDKKEMEQAFTMAYKQVTDSKLPKCPPIVYLPVDQSTDERSKDSIIPKIVGAPVIYEELIRATLVIDISQSKNIVDIIREAKRKNPGRKLKFRDVCIRCTAKLYYTDTPQGREVTEVKEINSDVRKPPNESKCHPLVIPKHATVTKIMGGIAHILTLGIFAVVGKARKKAIWPGFTNRQEMCLKCKKSPGEDGCSEVGKMVEIQTENGPNEVMTKHSTKLDEVQVETA